MLMDIRGVDFIKLDFMTPGSPEAGEELPADDSGAAIAYHKAIENAGVRMRLDISWKLGRSEPFWGIWRGTSDSLRVDQDINNSGEDTFVAYSTVLRTLDFYRGFINEQTVPERNGLSIMVSAI
jgi:alpha-galactosidase